MTTFGRMDNIWENVVVCRHHAIAHHWLVVGCAGAVVNRVANGRRSGFREQSLLRELLAGVLKALREDELLFDCVDRCALLQNWRPTLEELLLVF